MAEVMKKKYMLAFLVLSSLVTPTSAKADFDEKKITTLLNCAVIIASADGSSTNYEDYVVAAAYHAADGGKSKGWLSGKIKEAFETAEDFAEERGAAERCLQTLRSVEDS